MDRAILAESSSRAMANPVPSARPPVSRPATESAAPAASSRSWSWRWLGAGMALLTGSTLLLEIVLTRIFSVVLWYHYGFMAICLALLGVGLAGVFVYLYPERFQPGRVPQASAKIALAFAASIVLALLAFHWIVSQPSHWPLGTLHLSLIFVVIAVPFFVSGVGVAVVLSRCTERIGPLYAADLGGAAAGAVLVIPAIALLGGHHTVILCACLACASALCFSRSARDRRGMALAGVALVVCAGFLAWTLDSDSFALRYSKRGPEDRVIYKSWNSFSRVAVYEAGDEESFGWNLGRGAPRDTGEHHWIRIDGGAATPMISFDGDLDGLDYLRYDITSLGYQVRPQDNVLIVGSGGGRDILTAKLFGLDDIQAVEINPIIVDAVRNRFRDFSGSPYDLEGVRFAVTDARGFIARSPERYDHIQLAAVDTNAASAAGALALVEQTLYTVEAFQDYYDHLTDDGLVSVSRPWTPQTLEIALRTIDLVIEAWRSRGHEEPARHVAVVAGPEGSPRNWGTLIASRGELTPEDVASLTEVTDALGFRILYAPGRESGQRQIEALLGPRREEYLDKYPLDIRASTDDRPFFHYFRRPFRSGPGRAGGIGSQAGHAPGVLLRLFVLVCVLTVGLAFALPLLLGRLHLRSASGAGRALIYFACIGLGFLMVEIALLQRHTLLLGQPLYAFAVVLGTVLVSSGIGSYLTHSLFSRPGGGRRARLVLASIVSLALVHAFAMPYLLDIGIRWSLWSRLVLTVVGVAPLALLMGMPLPLGMRALEARAPAALAWGWGINGALSVMGSILAMTTSIFFGITFTLAAGAIAYLGAALCYPSALRVGSPARPEPGRPRAGSQPG
jgi:predicted membrane-bound spermidine synthase